MGVIRKLLLVVVCLAGCRPAVGPAPGALPLPDKEDLSGYTRAYDPQDIRLPKEMGPHPDFRSEWWYHIGHLETEAGRHFGFEVSFVRYALAPDGSPWLRQSSSAWTTRQAYLGMFCLTDVENAKFYCFERHSREALGLAGATLFPYGVWVDNWKVASQESLFPLRLKASQATPQGSVGVDLQLSQGRGPLLHGQAGLSRKSDTPGNASYYFSLSRMPVKGTVQLAGQSLAVTGAAWLDREWMTSRLERDQVGWDWFGVSLSDGRDLVVYRLRWDDGRLDSHCAGILVEADGTQKHLDARAFEIDNLEFWTSPRGARYPVSWRIKVPLAQLSLDLRASLKAQEKHLSMRYWEGLIEGRTSDGAITARGYAELTGYGKRR